MWEVPKDWKKAKFSPVFEWSKKDSGNCRLTNLTSILEQVLLKSISKHMKDKKFIGCGWYGLMKEEIMLDQTDRLLQPDDENGG